VAVRRLSINQILKLALPGLVFTALVFTGRVSSNLISFLAGHGPQAVSSNPSRASHCNFSQGKSMLISAVCILVRLSSAMLGMLKRGNASRFCTMLISFGLGLGPGAPSYGKVLSLRSLQVVADLLPVLLVAFHSPGRLCAQGALTIIYRHQVGHDASRLVAAPQSPSTCFFTRRAISRCSLAAHRRSELLWSGPISSAGGFHPRTHFHPIPLITGHRRFMLVWPHLIPCGLRPAGGFIPRANSIPGVSVFVDAEPISSAAGSGRRTHSLSHRFLSDRVASSPRSPLFFLTWQHAFHSPQAPRLRSHSSPQSWPGPRLLCPGWSDPRHRAATWLPSNFIPRRCPSFPGGFIPGYSRHFSSVLRITSRNMLRWYTSDFFSFVFAQYTAAHVGPYPCSSGQHSARRISFAAGRHCGSRTLSLLPRRSPQNRSGRNRAELHRTVQCSFHLPPALITGGRHFPRLASQRLTSQRFSWSCLFHSPAGYPPDALHVGSVRLGAARSLSDPFFSALVKVCPISFAAGLLTGGRLYSTTPIVPSPRWSFQC
jgi:hypothetical protein